MFVGDWIHAPWWRVWGAQARCELIEIRIDQNILDKFRGLDYIICGRLCLEHLRTRKVTMFQRKNYCIKNYWIYDPPEGLCWRFGCFACCAYEFRLVDLRARTPCNVEWMLQTAFTTWCPFTLLCVLEGYLSRVVADCVFFLTCVLSRWSFAA